MARRNKGIKLDGWVNLNKPVGMTSNQALGILKRALNPQKAGHAGTLDPLASGILPIALGEATKTVPYVQDYLKTYHFTVTWGEQRTTDDSEGSALYTSDARPTQAEIEALLPSFHGDVLQVPPQFSAIKIAGARAYDLAREGETVEIQPRPVYIEYIKILSHTPDSTAFEALCGKGTYVRSVARDLGQQLGCYGYISRLERASVGPFTLENAISLDFFQQEGQILSPDKVLLPLQTALDDIPALALKEPEAARMKQGQGLSFISRPDIERFNRAGIVWDGTDPVIALTTFNGKAIAIVEIKGPDISPLRIFNV